MSGTARLRETADAKEREEAAMTGRLIPPYGGALVDLVCDGEERGALRARAAGLRPLQLSFRSMCDLELLATGAFSPLDRFMDRAAYKRVVREMRLPDGMLWPIPVTLPAPAAPRPYEGEELALRSPHNDLIAVMRVDEAYPRNFTFEADGVFGTTDDRHPLVAEMNTWGPWYVSGPLRVVGLPRHYDFADLRRTPAQVRRHLAERGAANVVAFQTRNPMHRAHEELTKRAAARVDGTLLIHPVVGMTNPDDVDYYTRVRCYRALVERYYDPSKTLLSLLPLAMRMAGPREAVWHAIIRRNFGANHFVVGRDHAGPGSDSSGRPFYGPYQARTLAESVQAELGVTILPFDELVHLPEEARYEEASRVQAGARVFSLSGTQVRRDFLANGRALPAWFTRPEVADILARAYPPRERQGICIWFTGLSGAGKSSIAAVLAVKFMEAGRQVTVLDGDVVRTNLSAGLGFSRADRDTNIRRIGYVASEIVRHHGAVICAAISPYRTTRAECRAMVGSEHFVEVFVDTPLEVCEQRDPKGMYARARRGEIKEFTGIDDPYETPENPELTLTTVDTTPESNAEKIVQVLLARGFLAGGGGTAEPGQAWPEAEPRPRLRFLPA
jgi:sulfate adenylyltransferase